jgi:hypothetical protein
VATQSVIDEVIDRPVALDMACVELCVARARALAEHDCEIDPRTFASCAGVILGSARS